MIGISRGTGSPQALRLDSGGLLALVLLGFPLAAGLLDAPGDQVGLERISRLAAAPGLRASRLPAPEQPASDAVQVEQIPAIAGTGTVARDVEAVNLAVRYRQPVQRAECALHGFAEHNHGISHGSSSSANRPTTAASTSSSTASG
ncbi:hypothetical protein D3C78_1570670 [compost metagenome]